jgi:multisubunit Na+/H+ antiporter MnhB subunit
LTVSWKALQDLPRFGQPLLKVSDFYLKHGLEETGATNLIASIILDYRAYDSLGEAVLLFTAVMGVLAIVRSVGKKKEGVDIPEEDK